MGVCTCVRDFKRASLRASIINTWQRGEREKEDLGMRWCERMSSRAAKAKSSAKQGDQRKESASVTDEAREQRRRENR
eukprot:2183742-Pleurochrysis_carterae.AAC.1